jgi:hypothetical protein
VIGYIAALSVLVVALAYVFGIRAGILATLLLHPVAAAGWHMAYYVGPIKLNPLVVIGLIVPLFVMLRAFTRGPSFAKMPLSSIWILYVCYNTFAGTLHALDEGPGTSLNLISRHIAGFVGFYMLQAFFTERSHFRHLTIALVLSGVFPVLVVLYQILTDSGTLRGLSSGGDLRLDQAFGLVRYSGFYHDIVSVRGYVFQCLAGIVLYWAYFVRPNRDMVVKALLLGLMLASVFVLYKMYSKAVILTLLLWFGIWFFANGKLGLALVLGFLLIGVNALQSDLIFSEAETLFQVELNQATTEGEVDSARLLHGRVGAWQYALQGFFKEGFMEQMFGAWTAFGAHNDFLQKLFYGGFLGLTIYIMLLYKIGMTVLRMNLQSRSPINLMAAMVFCGWMVDTIGVVPSLYPGYQWYAWGVIGLAIKGLEFEQDGVAEKERKRKTAPPLAAESD